VPFKIGFLVALLMVGGLAGQVPQTIPCDVTSPNGRGSFGELAASLVYGNGAIAVSLGWPDGTIVFKPRGPGFEMNDGSLSMKVGWWREVPGALRIDGRRLDADAPPLRARVPCCYGERGFQATSLIFPKPGCWEVTGHVGEASLTFVTRVVKIGAGPG
jgi:hypothetical protein